MAIDIRICSSCNCLNGILNCMPAISAEQVTQEVMEKLRFDNGTYTVHLKSLLNFNSCIPKVLRTEVFKVFELYKRA